MKYYLVDLRALPISERAAACKKMEQGAWDVFEQLGSSILSPPFLCYNVSVRSLLAAVSFENRCALAVSSNSRQVRRLFCRHTPFCERR